MTKKQIELQEKLKSKEEQQNTAVTDFYAEDF